MVMGTIYNFMFLAFNLKNKKFFLRAYINKIDL